MQLTMKAARINAGMNQTDAGKAIGVSKSTIGCWERGETYPTLDLYDIMCNVYGVPFGSIILPKT